MKNSCDCLNLNLKFFLSMSLLVGFFLTGCTQINSDGVKSPVPEFMTLTKTSPPIPTFPSSNSTPDLIQQAFSIGKITNEQRLLYLAYALGDYEKLPSQYQSNIPWEGTLIALELNEAANSSNVMCELSLFTQSELRRILTNGISCNK